MYILKILLVPIEYSQIQAVFLPALNLAIASTSASPLNEGNDIDQYAQNSLIPYRLYKKIEHKWERTNPMQFPDP